MAVYEPLSVKDSRLGGLFPTDAAIDRVDVLVAPGVVELLSTKQTILRLSCRPWEGKRGMLQIGRFRGTLSAAFLDSGSRISVLDDIGGTGRRFNMTIATYKNVSVEIGEGTTSNGAEISALNGNVSIGADCMLAKDILFQSNDQHGIFSIDDGLRKINNKTGITVENNVWIGYGVTLLPGVTIGYGSVIGACSVVTKDIPPCCIAVGNPARVIRERICWSRDSNYPDQGTLNVKDRLLKAL